MTKRIYILYTGGTIGMQASENGYVPSGGFDTLIAEKIPLHMSSALPSYHLEELDDLIDSSNAKPKDWRIVAEKITQNYDQYDGFIILHGTDTLGYTASALSFMLRGLNKPVIITGSQIPLSELRNDAQDNLVTAIHLAGTLKITEVCVYFNGLLLRGNRTIKVKSTGFDAFDSPNYPWLGKVGINVDIGQFGEYTPDSTPAFELPTYGQYTVAPIRVFPGIDADYLKYQLNYPADAFILISYGVGNAPDQDPDFLQQITDKINEGKVIINISQCSYGGVAPGSYATGSSLAKTGIINGRDMTFEACFCKLHHLLSLGLDSQAITEKMAIPLAGEFSHKLM